VTTDENRRHWANADLLSADAANTPVVRRVLRSRSRYEVANNSYARGIVLTLANDCVGTGPRLQLLTDNDEANRTIESEFAAWAKDVAPARAGVGDQRPEPRGRCQIGKVYVQFTRGAAWGCVMLIGAGHWPVTGKVYKPWRLLQHCFAAVVGRP
jgi:capsid protein